MSPETEAAFDRHQRRQDCAGLLIGLAPMLAALVAALLGSSGHCILAVATLATIPLWVVCGVSML